MRKQKNNRQLLHLYPSACKNAETCPKYFQNMLAFLKMQCYNSITFIWEEFYMKKKVLAVLVAVCMIVSTCVLFASAATFAQNTYVEKINANANLLPDNIKAIASNAFNIDVTASAKTGITLNSGTTEVNDSNVDSLVQFKAGTATLTFAKDLASYFTVSGTISGNNATVNFAEKSSNNMEVYQVTSAIDTATDTDIAAKTSPVANAKKYNLSPATVNATVSKWVTKLSSVTMGVRFFGSTYDNLVASEIAKVNATVNRKSGAPQRLLHPSPM